MLISATATHRRKRLFFFLLQTDQGDIFKLSVSHADGEATGMELRYFDTVPVANSICLLKTGFLFVAAEFGNQ